jgi:hypothetical protein
MEKLINLFQEYILKAINLTESFLEKDFSRDVNFENFTENRERLFQIIDQISRQVNWTEIDLGHREELNRQIDYIKKLDEKILTKLQEYQTELKQEIENTVRHKDTIKGYNLSDVK